MLCLGCSFKGLGSAFEVWSLGFAFGVWRFGFRVPKAEGENALIDIVHVFRAEESELVALASLVAWTEGLRLRV